MNITRTGKVVFFGDADTLDEAIDYLEQYGETDFDNEGEMLTLILEEEWDQEWEENAINLMSEFHENIPDVNIFLSLTIQDHDSERAKTFECQYKNECLKYRDTEWSYDGYIDDDITYDEFEEEGHMEISEELFEEYVHKRGKGERREYSAWEYVDID